MVQKDILGHAPSIKLKMVGNFYYLPLTPLDAGMNIKSNQLTIFIPSLFTPGPKVSQLDSIDIPDLPSLSLILSRGCKTQIKSFRFLERCMDLFGHVSSEFDQKTTDIPFGPILYSLLENNSVTGVKQWIYKLNPVFLYPDMDQLILANDLSHDLKAIEAEEICQAINEYFNESEQDKTWQIVNPCDNQLFLISNKTASILTSPLEYVLGLPINQFLPRGKEANYWNQTLNEIQMLLFTLPFNNARKEKGQTAVNSLWPWGGGIFPLKTTNGSNLAWDRVFTDHSMVEKLAQFDSIQSDSLESFYDYNFSSSENYLLVSNHLLQAFNNNDVYSWFEEIKRLEQQIFTPALQALKDKNLSQINFIVADEQCFSINRRQVKSWWKRKKSFRHFLQ